MRRLVWERGGCAGGLNLIGMCYGRESRRGLPEEYSNGNLAVSPPLSEVPREQGLGAVSELPRERGLVGLE